MIQKTIEEFDRMVDVELTGTFTIRSDSDKIYHRIRIQLNKINQLYEIVFGENDEKKSGCLFRTLKKN